MSTGNTTGWKKAIAFAAAASLFACSSMAWAQADTDPLALSRTNPGFDRARSQATLGERFSGTWRVTHTNDHGQSTSGTARVADDGTAIALTLQGPDGDVEYDLIEAEAIRLIEGTGPFKAILTARFRRRGRPAGEPVAVPVPGTAHVAIPPDSDEIIVKAGNVERRLPVVRPENRIRVSISTRDSDEKYQGRWSQERGRDLTGGGIATWIRGDSSIDGVLVMEDQLEPSAGTNYPFRADGTPIAHVLRHRTLVIYGRNLPDIGDGADIESQSESIEYLPVFTTGDGRLRKIAKAFRIAGIRQPEDADAFILRAALTEGIFPGKKSLSVDGEIGSWKLAFANECGVVGADGSLMLPACTPSCTEKFWRWNFFVTNYNVATNIPSGGMGQHTGIFITGNSYRYDKRFPASMSQTEPTWKVGSPFAAIVEHPGRTESGVDDPVSAHALCSHEVLLRRNIFNHGRTIAREVSHSLLDRLDRSPIAASVSSRNLPVDSISTADLGPLEHREWSAPNNPSIARATATTACMEEITDGYCDSVCGNCSYVLPQIPGAAPVANSSITGQKVQFSRVEGSGAVRGLVEYVGHIRKADRSRYTGLAIVTNQQPAARTPTPQTTAVRDPFTHCSVPTTAPYPTQAISSPLALAVAEPQVVTGLYGHNSNTDAEAELIQFKRCGENPEQKPDAACEVCGHPRKNQAGQNEQWACLPPQTNRAEAKWGPTDGMHNIDDSELGKLPGKFPTCANTQNTVRGM